ncbi:cAMP and cAMP-inhibited cGMP 3',5'-cyclic phosphodiesterase 10A-like [Liolophura sinensis]|uniref:cAMP and cAMP-inhibited cGMP 3',5'-cyclic phosphodiesterase 10A-like n=1 Tax=Liolophura sinensis TaxID=3198878 RepID=UPI003158D45A
MGVGASSPNIAGKKVPLPGHGGAVRKQSIDTTGKHEASELSASDVNSYLLKHQDFYIEYSVEHVSSAVLEKILEKRRCHEKHRTEHGYRCPLIQTQYCDVKLLNKCEHILKLSEESHLDTHCLLNELCHVLAGALKADGFTLYVPEKDDTELCIYNDKKEKIPFGPVGLNTTVAAHAAKEQQTLLIKDIKSDQRFPKGVGREDYDCHSVICVPVILPSHDLIGIMEFTRDETKESFGKWELQTVNSLVSWVVVSLHEFQLNRILTTQTKLNDFLLGTTRIMFDDMMSIDSLIQNIMMYTKGLVNADRASLFLVDEEKQEMYADYFDDGKVDEHDRPIFEKKSQIRFSINRGIAGHVAKTGQSVNIHDAYKDPRFNADVDKATGFVTRSILCMPIISRGKVIGVIELVNKRDGDHFTGGDENAFKTFAVYCALALHYSKLYSLLKHQQDMYNVALELLSFHQQCSEEEYVELVAKPVMKPEDFPPRADKFDFYCVPYLPQLPELFIGLVVDLFGQVFDVQKLAHFILTVRKNYRPVQYHNWVHGFHVAQTVYCVLKVAPGMMTDAEAQAMIIAAICHDVDHRGFNNAFFQKTHQPLAALYTTSVMEQHHYKQTVTILQQQGSEIFSHLCAEDYKIMLERIQQAIIATDLALYFPTQKRLSAILAEGPINHVTCDDSIKDLIKNLTMTAADLSGVCKPWRVQQETAELVYEEFYMQGDEEKKRGLDVLPMMDRDKKDEMPKQQVGFLQFVCTPCYQTLCDALPGTRPLLDSCKENMENWRRIAVGNTS